MLFFFKNPIPFKQPFREQERKCPNLPKNVLPLHKCAHNVQEHALSRLILGRGKKKKKTPHNLCGWARECMRARMSETINVNTLANKHKAETHTNTHTRAHTENAIESTRSVHSTTICDQLWPWQHPVAAVCFPITPSLIKVDTVTHIRTITGCCSSCLTMLAPFPRPSGRDWLCYYHIPVCQANFIWIRTEWVNASTGPQLLSFPSLFNFSGSVKEQSHTWLASPVVVLQRWT